MREEVEDFWRFVLQVEFEGTANDKVLFSISPSAVSFIVVLSGSTEAGRW